MSFDNSNDQNNISFSKIQKASNDLFTGLLTEDNTASGIRILDVMANDQGNGKSLYSLDDGNNNLKDLLVQDLGRTEPLSTDKSAMGATIWITSTGKVGYDASSFSAATLARLNHLSAGESLTDTFTYAIRLSDGTLSWATASVKIDGVNDPAVITSGAQNGGATEIADGALGENTTTHTSSGMITFTDADSHDSHTVAFAANGTGYLGAFKAYLADGDDDDHHDDGDRRGGDRNESGSDADAVKWKFSVNDSALDHLAAGQTLTQTYNVVISDGHGGTTTQVVTITLTGTNDAPIITSAAQSGGVSEGDDGASMTATGLVTFADVDLIDSHALTVSVAAVHGTASVDADGTWHYTVSDTSAVDALAAGVHLADSFTVQVDDHHGGIVTQVVTIDITGTNDAAVIAGVGTQGLIETDMVLTTGGTLTISDVDSAATFQAQTGAAGSNGYGSFTIGTDGVWSYATDTAHNEFQDGVTYTDTLTVKSADDTTHTLTVNIVGSNDAAVLSADVVELTEGDTAAAISTSGTLTISDVDSAPTFVAQAGTAGNYGTFAVGTDGVWTYTASSAHNEFADGTTYHETFNVVSADGTATSVKITITGTNDGPVAVADTNALDAVVEAGVTPAAPINPANGLAGTWLGNGPDFSALTLFTDGRYMFMEGSGPAPNGGESGTWTYDATAGKIALHNIFDGNIGGGLAPDQNDTPNPVSFNAAQIALTIVTPANETVTLTGARQAVSTGIAGTWLNTPTTDAPFTALVIFEDHRFMYMEGGGLPPNGLEAGTYSYNPATGALQFFTTFDSNNGTGIGGLSPTLDHTTLTVTVNGDTLSVTGAPTAFLPMHRQFSMPSSPAVDPAFAGDATAVGNVLANDTDIDAGATHTVSAVNGVDGKVGVTVVGTYGSVVIGSDGNYIYTLDNANHDTNALAQGASASDVFTYTVMDEFGATSSSTLTINITGTNDGPVAVVDSNAGDAVAEAGVNPGNAPFAGDSTAAGNVLTNDTDTGDGKAVTSVGIFTGTYGKLTLDADGGYSYTLNNANPHTNALVQGAHAQDVFHYTMRDAAGATSSSTLTIDITGTNDGPVAVADTNALDAVVEAGALQPTAASSMVGTFLGDGAPFSVLSLFADGRYMYMEGDGQAPNGGEAGTWVYDAAAGKLALNCAFDNNIGGGLAPDQNGIFNPVTFNGAQVGLTIFNPDLDATVTLTGIRQAVGTGIAGTWLGAATADEPFYAMVLFDDHRFMYMEGAGRQPNGLEAGTYTYDPSSGALTFTTTFDNNSDGGVSPGVNGVALTAVINGDTLSISNGDFHLPPLARQFSDTQNATIDPAVAGDASAVGNVLSNDTDVDAGAHLTVSAVDGIAGNVGATVVGTYGSVVIGNDGSYTYTLDNADPDTNALAQGASASDVFGYTVTDEFGATSSSTLTIAITGANDAPVAVDNTRSATEKGGIANGSGGSNATGNVLFNDSDADTDHANLTVTAIRTGFTEGLGTAGGLSAPGVPSPGLAGAHGTLFMSASGGYSYLVNEADLAVQALNSTGPNTSLTDVFNYTVSDGGRTDTAVLTITIHGANDAPAVTAPVTLTAMAEDSGARLITQAELLAHAYDVDGPNLSAIGLAISSGQGALVNNNDGTWSYTPTANDDTAVTFSYSVTDGVASPIATSASLDITPVNDVATITGLATGSVTEDGTLTAGGVLTVADVDTGENHFQTPASLAGTYGEFTFDAASGAWGYTLSNDAANVQALGATEVVHDTLNVTSFDGTASQNIDVTIAGADEAPAGIGQPLAVAYYDRDANNIYDPAADTLYFGVFDTNGDGAVSAGDTLRADFYPANVAASTLFEFQNKDHVITAADWFPASHVLFAVAGSELVAFYKVADGEGVVNSTVDNYFNGGPELALTDSIIGDTTGLFAVRDQVYIEAGWATASTFVPTGPQTATDSQVIQLGNQPWLNVDFHIV